jgi:hypothetical protein
LKYNIVVKHASGTLSDSKLVVTKRPKPSAAAAKWVDINLMTPPYQDLPM